jgi:hypothetical protein
MKQFTFLRSMLSMALLFIVGTAFAQDWSFTFSSAQDLKPATATTDTLNGWNWVLTHNSAATSFYFESKYGKGIQIGTAKMPATSIVLTTSSSGANKISKIVVNTSGATDIVGTLTVSVGGTQLGKVYDLVRDATDVTFSNETAVSGPIKLAFSQTSSKGIYIKSIAVYYAPLESPKMSWTTPTVGEKYVLYNKTADAFLTRGYWWNAHAAVCEYQPTGNSTFNLIPSTGGTYQIHMVSMADGKGLAYDGDANSGSVWTDGNASDWNFSAQTDGTYLISSPQKAAGMFLAPTIDTGDGIDMYYSVFDNVTDTAAAAWTLCKESDYLLYRAQMDLYTAMNQLSTRTSLAAELAAARNVYTNPTSTKADLEKALEKLVGAAHKADSSYGLDVTYHVAASTFDRIVGLDNNRTDVPPTAWLWSGDCWNKGATTNASTEKGFAGIAFETWMWEPTNPITRDIYQNLAGLPNGVYSLTAAVKATNQADSATPTTGTNVFLYGGSAMTEIPVNITDVYGVDNIVVTDGTLRIGVKEVGGHANWLVLDNVKLYYDGELDLNLLTKLVQSQVDEAKTLLGNPGEKTIMDALAKEVSDATTALAANPVDGAALLAVSSLLTRDIPSAKTSIKLYANLVSAIAEANALKDSTDYPGKADFANAIALAQAIVDQGSADDAGVPVAIDALSNAVRAYKLSEVPNASPSNPLDLTFLITNPDMDLTTGWSDAGSYSSSEMEKYDSENINVCQTLHNLPAGVYRLTCQGFYRAGMPAVAASSRDAGTESRNASLYAFVTDTTKVPLMSILDEAQDARIYTVSGWQTDAEITLGGATKYIPYSMDGSRVWFDAGKFENNRLYFTINNVDSATIGIRKLVHIGGDWTMFDKFRLTYYGNSYTPYTNITAIGDPATSLADGQNYVAFNKGRNGFLYENENSKQLMLKSGATLTLPQPSTYAVKPIKSGDKYLFQIVGTGDYMQALAHGGSTYAGDVAMADTYTPAYNTSASCWYIKGTTPAGGFTNYWNGNPSTFTGWNAMGGNSAYILRPCTLSPIDAYASMLKDALAATATAISNYLSHKGQVGYPVDAAFDNLQNAYNKALVYYADGTCSDLEGYVGYSILQTAKEAFYKADRNMPKVGTFYQIQDFVDASRGALCHDSSIYPYVQATGHSGAAVTATNDFNFGVFVHGGKTYLYNAATKQFLVPVAAPTTAGTHYTSQDPDGRAGLVWEFTDTPTAVTLSTEGMSIPNFWIKTADDSRTLSISPSYAEPVITYYAAGDGGVPMTFTDMGAASEDVVTAISRYFVPAGKYYQIASAYNRGNLYFDSANTLNFVESTGKTGETVSDEDNFSFGIIDYMGATYVFNKANGEFLAPVAGTLDAGASADEQFGEYWQFVSAPTQVAVNYYKNDTYKISSVVKGLTKVLSIENRYFEPVTTYYAQNDEGFPMILTEKGDIEASRLADIQQMIYNGMVTGINTASKTVAGYEYYSTNGTKLQKAAKGVNIVRVHFTDGTSKISKIVVR